MAGRHHGAAGGVGPVAVAQGDVAEGVGGGVVVVVLDGGGEGVGAFGELLEVGVVGEG